MRRKGGYAPRDILDQEEQEEENVRIIKKQHPEYVRRLKDLMQRFGVTRVHEFGSGAGALAKAVQTQLRNIGLFLTVVCIDLSDDALKHARRFGFDTRPGDMTKKLYEDDELGDVLISFALQYMSMEDRLECFLKRKKDMRRGSRLIIGEQSQNMKPMGLTIWTSPILYVFYLVAIWLMKKRNWDPDVALKIPGELESVGGWLLVHQETWIYHGLLSELPEGQLENFWFKVRLIEKEVGKFSSLLAMLFVWLVKRWAQRPGSGFSTVGHLMVFKLSEK